MPTTTVSNYSYADDGTIESYGGISPVGPDVWTSTVERHGHAITGELSASGYRERFRHHDDARFAESRGTEGSMAAYYENAGDRTGILARTWLNDERLAEWLADGRIR